KESKLYLPAKLFTQSEIKNNPQNLPESKEIFNSPPYLLLNSPLTEEDTRTPTPHQLTFPSPTLPNFPIREEKNLDNLLELASKYQDLQKLLQEK
ncbi:4596_t:CDS:1, partial [Scutellospora calospora]